MEQRGMHPQRISHQTVHAYGHPSFEQSPLYPGFPELLGGSPKATQLPRPLPPYIQQHYTLDRGPPMEVHKSPPSHRSSDRPHGHPSRRHHPASPPQLQQPQPRQATAYSVFPQDHEAYHTTHVFSTQFSRAQLPQLPAHSMPLNPWGVAALADNANTQLKETEGGLPHTFESIYPSDQQSLSPLTATHPSSYEQAVSPKGSPTSMQNTSPTSPTSFQGNNEGNVTAENSPQPRTWGGAGSLDPATGVFSRAADHPRIRTAQACEKCRARKAKVCLLSLFIRVSRW